MDLIPISTHELLGRKCYSPIRIFIILKTYKLDLKLIIAPAESLIEDKKGINLNVLKA